MKDTFARIDLSQGTPPLDESGGLEAENPRESLIVNTAALGHTYGPDPTKWPEWAIRQTDSWLLAALRAAVQNRPDLVTGGLQQIRDERAAVPATREPDYWLSVLDEQTLRNGGSALVRLHKLPLYDARLPVYLRNPDQWTNRAAVTQNPMEPE